MNSARLARAVAVVEETVAGEPIPGAVLLVARWGAIVLREAIGHRVRRLKPEPMTADTLFDLASLTKVVATLPAVLMLLERGRFRLDDPVARELPEFAVHGKESITVRHLLTHTSGLAALPRKVPDTVEQTRWRAAVCAAEPEGPPGRQVVYSDTGFLALQFWLEAVTGERLDRWVERNIYGPLGMERTGFSPSENAAAQAAATEFAPDHGGYLRGVVHDERARGMGGVAGHAGLFATADDLARYGQLWLNGGSFCDVRLLSPQTVRKATQNHVAHLNAYRGWGWVVGGSTYSSGGDLLSCRAFGHTGFTGTSIWLDPALELMAILLTNRVHLGREETDEPIRRLRARFHNAVVSAIDKSADSS